MLRREKAILFIIEKKKKLTSNLLSFGSTNQRNGAAHCLARMKDASAIVEFDFASFIFHGAGGEGVAIVFFFIIFQEDY